MVNDKEHLPLNFSALRLGETRKINVLVHDKNCAHAQCAVTMVTSNGTMTSAPLEMKTECYDFLVTPEVPGQHTIRIEYAGKEVSGSPFALDVEVIDISSVKVKGLQTCELTCFYSLV